MKAEVSNLGLVKKVLKMDQILKYHYLGQIWQSKNRFYCIEIRIESPWLEYAKNVAMEKNLNPKKNIFRYFRIFLLTILSLFKNWAKRRFRREIEKIP